MPRAALAILLSLPAIARARPVVIEKGPIITGVTQTEAWITWETRRTTSGGPLATLRVSPPAGREALFVDGAPGRIHHVHLIGLRPATDYALFLGGEAGDASGRFTTAPADPAASFKFVVYGDDREPDDDQPRTRAAHEALMRAIARWDDDAAFVVQTGDLALNYTRSKAPERGYAEFFDVEHQLLATHPIFAALGNHDKLDADEFDAFVNPAAFAGSPHRYYWSFDWGRAHFAIVDAFEGALVHGGPVRRPGISPEQAAWLDADLKAASARGAAIFVVSHHSPFSHILKGGVGHGGSVALAAVLVPLMQRYHAVALLAGHDHFYMRDQEQCLTFLIVGSGGAPMYDPDPKAPGVVSAHKETAYLSVTVSPDDIVATARNVKGETLDTTHLAPADVSACRGDSSPAAARPVQ